MKKLVVVLDVGSPVEKSLGGTTNFHPASDVLSPSGMDLSPWKDAVSVRPQDLGSAGGERGLSSVGLGLPSQK